MAIFSSVYAVAAVTDQQRHTTYVSVIDHINLSNSSTFERLLRDLRGTDAAQWHPPALPSPLSTAVRNNDLDKAELLLRHGANINAVDGTTGTPLLIAMAVGSPDMIRLLMQHQPDLSMLIRGDPYLVWALVYMPSAISTLLDAGADPSQRSSTGLTAADVAYLLGHHEYIAVLGLDRLTVASGPEIVSVPDLLGDAITRKDFDAFNQLATHHNIFDLRDRSGRPFSFMAYAVCVTFGADKKPGRKLNQSCFNKFSGGLNTSLKDKNGLSVFAMAILDSPLNWLNNGLAVAGSSQSFSSELSDLNLLYAVVSQNWTPQQGESERALMYSIFEKVLSKSEQIVSRGDFKASEPTPISILLKTNGSSARPILAMFNAADQKRIRSKSYSRKFRDYLRSIGGGYIAR